MSHLGAPKQAQLRDVTGTVVSLRCHLIWLGQLRFVGVIQRSRLWTWGMVVLNWITCQCAELTRAKRFSTIIRQNNSPPLGMYERQKLSTVNH
jgi:hypothetical protein